MFSSLVGAEVETLTGLCAGSFSSVDLLPFTRLHHAAVHMLTRRDRRILLRISRRDASRDTGDLSVIVRVLKIGEGHAIGGGMLSRRIDHTMLCGDPAIIRPLRQKITHIDDDLVLLVGTSTHVCLEGRAGFRTCRT